MINSIRKAQESEKGFTLVELLVVIIIIGILAAVAIPAFLNQRQRANDSAVQADVKNVATQIETALVEEPNATSVTASASAGTVTVSAGSATTGAINLTEGVTVDVSGEANGYVIRGAHVNGKQFKNDTEGSLSTGDTVLVFNSATGGIQSGATTV